MDNKQVTEVKAYIVYLPLDKHTSLKVYAAKKSVSISSIFKDLVDQFLKKEGLL